MISKLSVILLAVTLFVSSRHLFPQGRKNLTAWQPGLDEKRFLPVAGLRKSPSQHLPHNLVMAKCFTAIIFVLRFVDLNCVFDCNARSSLSF